MKTPPHVIAYRSVETAVVILILLLLSLGLAGSGPLDPLHSLTRPISHALHLDRIGG